MIRFWTLGGLELRDSDDQELRAILSQPKRLALLAYLALHSPHGFVSRDRVLALFWPEQSTERARSALNRAIYFVRRSLGPDVVLNRGDEEIGLSSTSFWCDASAFQTASSSGAHANAVELYRGDLLDGFHISGATGFEPWLESERARLRGLASRSAWALAEADEKAGNLTAATRLARWAAGLTPYDEAAWRRLFLLLDRTGDRAGAVHEYDHLARQLADELELVPAPETRALIEKIRSRDLMPIVPAQDQLAIRIESLDANTARTDADGIQSPPTRTLRRRVRTRIAAAAGVVMLSLAVAGLLERMSPPVPLDPRLVLVADIENQTKDAALDTLASEATRWIAHNVSDAVEAATALTSMRGARVVRPPADARGRRGREPESRAGIRVSGELYRERGVLRFHVRVVDVVHDGRVWAVPPLRASLDSTDAVIREMGERAAGAVAALIHPRLANWLPIATPPPTHDALIEFVRAMEVPRWWQAGPYYERAANLDTTFTLALIKAARAQMATNPARSQEIVETLEQNRHSLPRLQVLMLNALTASFAGDRMAEYEAWAGAAALAPAEFLYPYAMAANALYRPRETLWLLDRAEYPARAGVPPSTWLIRTDLHHQLGERREEIALARQARRARPHRLDALYKYVRGLAASGRVQEVIALIDTALNAPRDPDYTPGAIMQVAAEELRAHGFAVAAADIVEREIQWYRSTPATGADTLAHYNNLAGALYRANQWDDAARLFETLAAAHPVQRADLYGRLGAIAARRGDRALTQRYLAILKHLDWPNEGPTYEAYISCARIAALLGQESEALQYLRIAVGGQGLDLHADMDFESLRNNPDFREFTRPRG